MIRTWVRMAGNICRIAMKKTRGCLLLTLLLGAGRSGIAQQLEPRAYSPSPVDTTFLVVAFARASGGVVFDPTVPITNVNATLYSPVIGLGRTVGVFGRQGLIAASLPYVWGHASGEIGQQAAQITRSGLADVQVRFSLNLHGSPTLTARQFAVRRNRSFIVGTSLTVSAPTGQYDNTKLVNLGTNRWAFKPELGFSYPLRKFDLDLYLGGWFFTENPRYFPGQAARTQDFLATAQAHVSYTVKRGLWMAFDSTWYGGGAARTDGGPAINRQNNTRLGATVSLPLGKSQSLKMSYGSGVTARTGSNFQTLTVAWQHVWLDRH